MSRSEDMNKKNGDAWIDALYEETCGVAGHVTTYTVMRYVAGVVLRERERLAEVMAAHGLDQSLIKAVLSSEKDRQVFQFRPPSTKVNDVVQPAKSQQA